MAENMEMIDLGHKPKEIDQKEKYYSSMTIPLELVEGEKKIGRKISLHVVGSLQGVDEDGVRIELKKAGIMKGISEEEYMEKTDEEKDEIDAKDLEEKKPKEGKE